jgi:hypothetical protein
MAQQKTWVGVVGYGHEVVHTGVLRALLKSQAKAAVAAALTCRDPHCVASVDEVVAEQRLPGARGKADLVARVGLTSGAHVAVAVETKVHSDGTSEQLERITEGSRDSEGILLVLGLTSLKLLPAHTEQASAPDGPSWHWVGPEDWLRILQAVLDLDLPWLPAYRSAVRSWANDLNDRQGRELRHLRWMNQVLKRLSQPERWSEIRTSQSGPLLSRFDWREKPSKDIYLEFMGHHDESRDLRLKIGGGTPEQLDDLAARLLEAIRPLPQFHTARTRHGRSRSVAVTQDLQADAAEAALAASEAVDLLDELFPPR